MMHRFIALLGANATGKSTRMNEYIKTLGDPDSVLDYHFHKNGEDIVLKSAGHIYGDMLIVGRHTRKGSWAGGDYTMGRLGSIVCIQEFFTHLDSIGIKTVVYEAFFGAANSAYRPEQIHKYFEDSHCYWFLYDDIQDYIDRTSNRSGRPWAERNKTPFDSAGWKGNLSFFKAFDKTTLAVSGTNSTVERVSITAPRDWLIEEMKNYTTNTGQ